MKYCVNGHESITYEGKYCPLCVEKQDNFDLKIRIAEFIQRVESLKMEMKKTDIILARLKVGIAAYGKQYTDDTTGMNEFKRSDK